MHEVVAVAGFDLGGGDGGLLGLLAVLAVLALVDSTSFGTLLIPVWLLTAPGPIRVGRVLAYLGTVAACYLAVGLALVAGADVLVDRTGGWFDTDGFRVAQLVVGGGMLAGSFAMDSPRAKARAAQRAEHGGGRVRRWRARAVGGDGVGPGSTRALVGLALTATALELATMLPYLAAIGLIATEGPAWPGPVPLLAGYCLVMVLPATVLLVGRAVAGRALEGPLRRLDGWLTRHAASTTAWVVGIVGVLLGLDALDALGWR